MKEREGGRISELCESKLRISSVRMRRREIESKKSQRRALLKDYQTQGSHAEEGEVCGPKRRTQTGK